MSDWVASLLRVQTYPFQITSVFFHVFACVNGLPVMDAPSSLPPRLGVGICEGAYYYSLVRMGKLVLLREHECVAILCRLLSILGEQGPTALNSSVGALTPPQKLRMSSKTQRLISAFNRA